MCENINIFLENIPNMAEMWPLRQLLAALLAISCRDFHADTHPKTNKIYIFCIFTILSDPPPGAGGEGGWPKKFLSFLPKTLVAKKNNFEGGDGGDDGNVF